MARFPRVPVAIRSVAFLAAVAAGAPGCASAPEAPAEIPQADLGRDTLSEDAIERIADRVVAKLERRPAGAGGAYGYGGGGGARAADLPRRAGVPAAAAALREFGRGSDRVAPPERVEPLTRAETEQFRSVVPLALGWLARNQEEDGRWSASRHGGEPGHDVGVTGLAMLAFVGAGNTNASGEHAAAVKKAVTWIVSQQDAEGCIGPRNRQHFMYDHAWASLALVESYALSQSPALKIPAQRAVDFVVRARNPYLGWRYGVRDGDNDTSMTGTMVMVLKSAKLAGLAVDDMAFKGALSWFEKMTDSDTGRTGYITRGGAPARTSTAADRFPPERVETPTAIASVARAFCGLDPATDPVIAKGAALVASKPPVWRDDSVDFHWWYWGTLATFQRGGDEWRAWSARLVRALGPNQQRGSGADAGSWTADDPWTAEGGRVYATSMACLAAQIVQRYASAGR